MFHLLLKAANDCGIDTKSQKKNLRLEHIEQANNVLLKDNQDFNNEMLSTSEHVNDSTILEVKPDQVHVIGNIEIIGKSISLESWKDLAMVRPELKDFISTKSFESFLVKPVEDINESMHSKCVEDTPLGRFNLMGGLYGVCKSMRYFDLKPVFKSFNIMLQVLFNSHICKTKYIF